MHLAVVRRLFKIGHTCIHSHALMPTVTNVRQLDETERKTRHETNRQRFRELCDLACITQVEAAAYIAEETKRPCGGRTVRSWLADYDTKSSRGCPDWAVTNLEAALKRAGKLVKKR